MRHSDYRADRAHAALLQRQAALRELLARKDETKPFNFGQGFVYLIRGTERLRLEQEVEFIDSLLEMLAAPME